MKIILIAILLMSSCGQNIESGNNSQPIQVANSKTPIDESVTDQIIDYYKQKLIDYDLDFEKIESDTLIELVFTDPNSVYIHTVFIELEDGDFVFGDLDNNGSTDMVTGLRSEYAASSSDNEIFTFLNLDGKLILQSVLNSTEISGCEYGAFYPQEIKEGFITGKSLCYAEEDARCCPSLNYETTVFPENNTLVFKNKTVIE